MNKAVVGVVSAAVKEINYGVFAWPEEADSHSLCFHCNSAGGEDPHDTS